MLDSPRYHRICCGLLVHPPEQGSEYQCVHEQGKAAVAAIVDLVLISVLGVSPLCLPREAWPEFVNSLLAEAVQLLSAGQASWLGADEVTSRE